ncbi:MAG: hypothetical protein ACI89U_001700 [Gammaproteobacteria bacterium]
MSAQTEGFTLEAIFLGKQWHATTNEEEFYRLVASGKASREAHLPTAFPSNEGLCILITGRWNSETQLTVESWEKAGMLAVVFLLPETKADQDSMPQSANYVEVRL